LNNVELLGLGCCSVMTHVVTIMNFLLACRITPSASEDGSLLHWI